MAETSDPWRALRLALSPPFGSTDPGPARKADAMSRRIIKVYAAGALLVSALAGAWSATATSWSTNFASGPSFSATAPAAKFRITAWACTAAWMNALFFAWGVTTGSIVGFSCHATAVTAGCGTTPWTGLTVMGSMAGGFYTNSTSESTIATTGQSLMSVWSPGGCTTLLGTSPGLTIFGKAPNPSTGDPETLVATATSSFKPSIVQS
jgi:hypothetical protein